MGHFAKIQPQFQLSDILSNTFVLIIILTMRKSGTKSTGGGPAARKAVLKAVKSMNRTAAGTTTCGKSKKSSIGDDVMIYITELNEIVDGIAHIEFNFKKLKVFLIAGKQEMMKMIELFKDVPTPELSDPNVKSIFILTHTMYFEVQLFFNFHYSGWLDSQYCLEIAELMWPARKSFEVHCGHVIRAEDISTEPYLKSWHNHLLANAVKPTRALSICSVHFLEGCLLRIRDSACDKWTAAQNRLIVLMQDISAVAKDFISWLCHSKEITKSFLKHRLVKYSRMSVTTMLDRDDAKMCFPNITYCYIDQLYLMGLSTEKPQDVPLYAMVPSKYQDRINIMKKLIVELPPQEDNDSDEDDDDDKSPVVVIRVTKDKRPADPTPSTAGAKRQRTKPGSNARSSLSSDEEDKADDSDDDIVDDDDDASIAGKTRSLQQSRPPTSSEPLLSQPLHEGSVAITNRHGDLQTPSSPTTVEAASHQGCSEAVESVIDYVAKTNTLDEDHMKSSSKAFLFARCDSKYSLYKLVVLASKLLSVFCCEFYTKSPSCCDSHSE